MPNIVQVLRSIVAAARPAGRQPGEPFVNYPDMQFGVVDVAGTAIDLLPVRFFSTTAHYNVGDYAWQGGFVWRCATATGPGAFVPASWTKAMTAADVAAYLPLAGGTMTGPIVLAADPAAPLQPATKQYADSKAPLASPVLTGDPQAPTPPPGDNDASVATTAFVVAGFAPIVSPVFTGDPKAPTPPAADNDQSVATTAFVNTALGNSGVVVSDTPPAGPLQGKLWFDSVSGQLYVFYNDGNSSQWVVATNNSPDLSQVVTKIVPRVFTTVGTTPYVPSPGLLYAVIEVQAGGSGGGGVQSGTAGKQHSAGGGAGGSYAKKTVTAADIGAGQTVTVGAGGAGGGNGLIGISGGASSVGSLCSAPAGTGGGGGLADTAGAAGSSGGPGVGDYSIAGGTGGLGSFAVITTMSNYSGAGGNSFMGQGGIPLRGVNAGFGGTGYGAGGSGASTSNAGGGLNGGPATQGIVIITEYCH